MPYANMCMCLRMLGQAVRTSSKHMEREQYYVTQPAIGSDSLMLKKARPQGELPSLWFPEAPQGNRRCRD